jgi:hypothetical protein
MSPTVHIVILSFLSVRREKAMKKMLRDNVLSANKVKNHARGTGGGPALPAVRQLDPDMVELQNMRGVLPITDKYDTVTTADGRVVRPAYRNLNFYSPTIQNAKTPPTHKEKSCPPRMPASIQQLNTSQGDDILLIENPDSLPGPSGMRTSLQMDIDRQQALH